VALSHNRRKERANRLYGPSVPKAGASDLLGVGSMQGRLVNQQRLSRGTHVSSRDGGVDVSSGEPILPIVKNEMTAKMQNMETARCHQLQYDELELRRSHVALPPKLFGMGQTWAPSPLPFPVGENDDGFEEGEIIDTAMLICILACRLLVGPAQPPSAIC
jgi:hypothetical protein